MTQARQKCDIAVIGAGPAGLAAAEIAVAAGCSVHVFERMPTPARKFLMAGKSGLNITHSEAAGLFLTRYGAARENLTPALNGFSPDDIVAWMNDLGEATFVGSSGRVFPRAMKASPLLRRWLKKLDEKEVELHTRCLWTGWDKEGCLTFQTPTDTITVNAGATILALGGTSWPKLGSVGEWVDILAQKNVRITPFQGTNCGFTVAWSEHFKSLYAGLPLKNVNVRIGDTVKKGEFVIAAYGVEGSLIYSVSSDIRRDLKNGHPARVHLDLVPDRNLKNLTETLTRPRGKRSLSNHIRKRTGLQGVKLALLYECLSKEEMNDPATLAQRMKALEMTVTAGRPIEEAISVAGGITFESMDENAMLNALPGVFCAGEMTNWEAPTGGYLLSACLAQGRLAANGAIKWLKKP